MAVSVIRFLRALRVLERRPEGFPSVTRRDREPVPTVSPGSRGVAGAARSTSGARERIQERVS